MAPVADAVVFCHVLRQNFRYKRWYNAQKTGRERMDWVSLLSIRSCPITDFTWQTGKLSQIQQTHIYDKKHPLSKISSNVANLPLYYGEGKLGAAFGYIVSFKMESNYHRRIELPVYENSICISFPDKKFSRFRGDLYVEDDLLGTKWWIFCKY